MKRIHTLLALALLASPVMAHAAPNCTISLGSNDAMQFTAKTVSVSASCKTITVELAHNGKLPVAAMGHNLVIAKTADVAGLAKAGVAAGAAGGYLPDGDARIIAHTRMLGGGDKDKTTFPGSKLTAGGDYTFFCSFPGHSALMKGKVVVEN